MKIDNTGALSTKIYVNTIDGRTIPFVQPDDLPKNMIEVTVTDQLILDEFLATVSFKRTTDIEGYSSTKIQFTFIPIKLTTVHQKFTLFFENQDYTKPI